MAKDYLIVVAKEKNYAPSWVPFRWAALDEARAQYRTAFGSEPKEHWTTGMIGSMIRNAEPGQVNEYV